MCHIDETGRDDNDNPGYEKDTLILKDIDHKWTEINEEWEARF